MFSLNFSAHARYALQANTLVSVSSTKELLSRGKLSNLFTADLDENHLKYLRPSQFELQQLFNISSGEEMLEERK